MSEQNYPGLILVENFLEKLNIETLDISLETLPTEIKKEQKNDV